ncbi:C-C motif chemokine 15-like isoform X2 [Odocoileus virginianus]|uniref:C-C motif chemokine 15-like isoform X2 n=1 Tax=Odocoileus virginianus TaxID=9874 RepID=A0ABM4J3V7_ODOVR
MKTSVAALPFLILAAQAAREDMVSNLNLELSRPNLDRHSLSQGGFHRPTDCCVSYTPRNIRCVFMKSYIETSSACSQPAVIFVTKSGQRVCADPNNEGVQKCKSQLRLGSAVEDLRSLLLERGRLERLERAPSAPSLLPHRPHSRALA